eukprot:TRINITY_DN4538_c0_g1_i1.p2 TRINITY_DN4538_c0_g1~~TRINITY_DN4538_c0_g1_i1.p2  ORF type:complete len:261 (-),score=108.56 TRINITY_DN4538_c0_g1_i1:40-789(-)
MPKTVLVTGATAGFGEGIARRFAAEGWQVVITGRRKERLDALAAELGPTVHPVQMDVQDRAQVEACIASLPPTFAALDVLVNNAGLALGTAPCDVAKLEDWETMINTNIKGLLYCTRLVLPGMIERGGGHIINIGSVAGEWPYPGGNVYGGTKAFVRQFSHNLRCDVVGKNIHATDIEPGLAETEFSQVRFFGDLEKAASVYSGMQSLTPADIAEACFWVSMRPPHVNINRIEITPESQALNGFNIVRK